MRYKLISNPLFPILLHTLLVSGCRFGPGSSTPRIRAVSMVTPSLKSSVSIASRPSVQEFRELIIHSTATGTELLCEVRPIIPQKGIPCSSTVRDSDEGNKPCRTCLSCILEIRWWRSTKLHQSL